MIFNLLHKINAWLDRPLVLTGLMNHKYQTAINPNTGKPFIVIHSPSRPHALLAPAISTHPTGVITKIDAAFLHACDKVCKQYKKILIQPSFKAFYPIQIVVVPHGHFDQKKFSRYAGDPDRGKRRALTLTRRTAGPLVLIYPEMFPEWVAHELLHVAEDIYNVPLKDRNHAWVYFTENEIADTLKRK